MLSEDRVRLLHMIEAAETALRFIEGRSRTDLDTDKMLRFALVRAIEIMGEAASRMSRAFQDETTKIPWALIVAMRNRLIHAYYDIDRDILWRTVTRELPDLLPKLHRLMNSD